MGRRNRTLGLLLASLLGSLSIGSCATTSGAPKEGGESDGETAAKTSRRANENVETSPLEIPTRWVGDRIFAEIEPGGDSDPLWLYLDTAGNEILFADVAKRLRLEVERVRLSDGEDRKQVVSLPTEARSTAVPEPLARNGRLLVRGRPPFEAPGDDMDGMLGPGWFGGRLWTIDFPERRLILHRSNASLPEAAYVTELGIADKEYPFGRVTVRIDGEPVDLLFDTGAHTYLTETAFDRLDDGRPRARATSFIGADVFARWREAHPEWRVVEEADATIAMAAPEKGSPEAMIRVPEVQLVDGLTVGPVWFTRRAQSNFTEYMSQWTDRTVVGALGNNALRKLVVTVDYSGETLRFSKSD